LEQLGITKHQSKIEFPPQITGSNGSTLAHNKSQSMQARKRKATAAFKKYVKRAKAPRAGYAKAVVTTPSIVSTRTGPGNFLKLQLIYCETAISLDSTLGAFSSYQFKTNDIYDPNFTGIGHQPSTHDQMSVIFEKYCVYACDYKITIHNTSATTPSLVGVYVSDSSSAPSSFRNAVEQGLMEYDTLGVLNSGQNIVKYSGHVYNPKQVGKTYQEYITSPEYVTDFGSNPTNPIFLTAITTSADTTSPSPQQRFTIQLRYHAILTGSKPVAES
jgi:hypothetical protein